MSAVGLGLVRAGAPPGFRQGLPSLSRLRSSGSSTAGTVGKPARCQPRPTAADSLPNNCSNCVRYRIYRGRRLAARPNPPARACPWPRLGLYRSGLLLILLPEAYSGERSRMRQPAWSGTPGRSLGAAAERGRQGWLRWWRCSHRFASRCRRCDQRHTSFSHCPWCPCLPALAALGVLCRGRRPRVPRRWARGWQKVRRGGGEEVLRGTWKAFPGADQGVALPRPATLPAPHAAPHLSRNFGSA